MPTPSSLKHRESLSPIYNDLPLANPDSVQLGEEASGVEGHVNNSGTTRMSSDSNYLALEFDAGISGRRGVRYGTGRCPRFPKTSLLLEPEERSRPLDCSWQGMTLISQKNPEAREILRLGKSK